MTTRTSSQKGFTLIEVLVALMIVSVSAAAVLSTISAVTRNARGVQMRTLGTWIAMNKVTEIRLAQGLPSAGRDDGEIEYAGFDWRWESEIKPPSAEVENFMRIEVAVWLDGREEAAADVVGFVGQSGNGALARPFDSRTPTGGAGVPDNPGDGDNPAPVVPGGRLTPRGEGT